MDDVGSTSTRFISILILLGFSGFFAACEAAFFSLNSLQVTNLKKNKGLSGSLAHNLLKKPRHLLVTIYIGNEVANVAISALSTSIAFTHFGTIGISLAIGVSTFLLLLLGEIVPKTLSLKYAESFTLLAARPLNWFNLGCRPITQLLVVISEKLIIKLGINPHEKNLDIMSDEELKTMVDIGENQGDLEEEESRMIQNVIQFGETTVEAIMTPRIEIFTLIENETMDDILPKIMENFYSRVPVFDEKEEEIKGVLFTKELNRLKNLSPENFKLKNYLRPPLFVPQSKNIKELLQEFKKQKRHMAIVLDEFGSVCGLVTLEDILEELVGEIDSEMRKDEHPIIKSPTGTVFRVSGSLSLADFNRQIQCELPEDKFDTIGGMVFGLFGRVPRSGESVTYETFKFTVEKMKGPRIIKLALTHMEPNEEDSLQDDSNPKAG